MLYRGIQKKYFNIGLEKFLTKQDADLISAKENVEKYIRNFTRNFEIGHGIVLHGDNGVGKSFLANIIIKEAYRHRYSSMRCTLMKYSHEYRRGWSVSPEEKDDWEDAFYKDYKAVEFLALEEIGKEYANGQGIKVELEDLLRYREENLLPTIVCTNIDITTTLLAETYGPSIASLLFGNYTHIGIYGSKDLRRTKFKEKRDA